MNTKEQRFSKLVKEHEQTIYAVCHMFSRDADDVDDLHQEILLRLWQGYDGFEGRSDIKNLDLPRGAELLYQLQQQA